MYLVFDTETNGKIKGNYEQPIGTLTLGNFPRVTQLAFKTFDFFGEQTSEYQAIIKPDGWTVPKEKFFIDNNISTERCEEEGIPLQEALEVFCQSVDHSQLLIAHNMSFDHRVLSVEMLRSIIFPKRKVNKFCTMMAATPLLKIPKSRYVTKDDPWKYPKLEELYRWLFKKEFDGAHDAMWDVTATSECFFEMKERNLINL